MKFVTPQANNESIAAVLLCVAAVSAVCAGVRAAGYAGGQLPDPNSITQAIEHSQSDPNSLAAWVTGSKKVADTLKTSGMFMPLPPKPSAPREVSGILGNQVLMGGKWYKVGDSMGGAKVLSIEATYVNIEFEGKEIKLAPIKASDPKGGRKIDRPKPKRERPERIKASEVKEEIIHQPVRDNMPRPVERRVRRRGRRERREGRRDRRNR